MRLERAPGWSVWPAPHAKGFGTGGPWRWQAWGDAGEQDGLAKTRAEAVELAQRAERRLCGAARVLRAVAPL